MSIKTIEDFKNDCNNKRCNRGTIYNEQKCITESKQNSCYTKYLKKIEKDKEKKELQIVKSKEKQIKKLKESSEEWEQKKEDYFSGKTDTLYTVSGINEKEIELKKIVWLRDTGVNYNGNSKRKNWQDYCVFWNFIFTKEEKLLIIKNSYKDLWLNESLDLVHIESRANRPDLVYNLNNIILGGRLWHSRLDQYRNLITGKIENKEYRDIWINRIKKYIKNIKG